MYKADYETNELFLYDGIGSAHWGFIDAETVMTDLAKMVGKRVTLRISSPGGSVDEGRLIYNALQRHKSGVDVVIDSSAYSIASYIAMAGDRVVMANNAMMMIHNPWTMAMGDSAELRKIADVLDKYRDSILDAYTSKTGKDRKKVKALLDAETWYTAQEAVDAGFATEVGDIVVDAPRFARAMYGEETTKGDPLETPRAGTRTPWPISGDRVVQNIKVNAQHFRQSGIAR